MSLPLLQIFVFMLLTFLFGLALGWVIWRMGGATQKELQSATTEVDFWRKNLEQCRMELGTEQNKVVTLQDEAAKMKKQILTLKNQPKD